MHSRGPRPYRDDGFFAGLAPPRPAGVLAGCSPGVGSPVAGPSTSSDASSKYACPVTGAVYSIYAHTAYVSSGTSDSTSSFVQSIVP